MYRYIKTLNSYIDNQFEDNNYSMDKILTLQSTLLTSTVKHNTRILFKLDSHIADSIINTYIANSDVKFIYRFGIKNMSYEDYNTLTSTIDIHFNEVSESWGVGLGDFEIENENGVTWNSANTNDLWSTVGGKYTTVGAIVHSVDLFDYNSGKDFYFDVDLTDLITEMTATELKTKGIIIKFSDAIEDELSDFITFEFSSANENNDLPTNKILPGLYVIETESNIFTTITDEERLTNSNRFDAIIKILNRGKYEKTTNIVLPITILDSSISTSIGLIPGINSTYKIIDYYSNVTVIPIDSANTIKYLDNKLYFDIDPSVLKSGRTYKFVPIFKTDGDLEIQTSLKVIFEMR